MSKSALAILFIIITSTSYAQETNDENKSVDTEALTNWKRAYTSFREAAKLVVEEKYKEAKTLLSELQKKLPPPYNNIAGGACGTVDMFLSGNYLSYDKKLSPEQIRQKFISSVWWDLDISWESISLHQKDEPANKGLLENYDDLAARIKYMKANGDLPYENLQNKPNDLATFIGCINTYCIQYTDTTRYNCYFCYQFIFLAMREIDSTLPLVRGGEDRIKLYTMAIICLHRLGDTTGRDAWKKRLLIDAIDAISIAQKEEDKIKIYNDILFCLNGIGDSNTRMVWEDKLLQDFSSNIDACAEVYAQRGFKAYNEKQLDEALKNYKIVCDKYPNSKSYGIAQFNVGCIIHQQKKYQLAIVEYSKLLKSKVNNQDPTPNIMSPYRNYQHTATLAISECYEALGDYENALKAVEDARDRYRYETWCGTCAMEESESLKKRIEHLKSLIQEQK